MTVALLGEYDGEIPLAQVVFDVSELLWLASVLNAAIPQMNWSKERNE